MDLKLQDIKQQATSETIAGCNRCDQSVISITEGVFRCFPGSESAVTYRALLHENCKISSLELEQAIERWISSGKAIVVRSLVLRADPSCPVVVGDVNDPECVSHDATDPHSGTDAIDSHSSTDVSDSHSSTTSNTISIIVGGASGALLGTVLLVGTITVVIVMIVTIFKHRQTMATLMGNEIRYDMFFMVFIFY